MQKIYRTALSPEQYVPAEQHRQVPRPEHCGNCGKVHSLEALSYYHRFVTTFTAAVLPIWVRRFICRFCRRTTSCLPEFALSYRLVNSATVADGFSERTSAPVARWSEHIRRYWRDFNAFLDELLRTLGQAFGPLPLRPTARGFWQMLLQRFGPLGAATEELVHRFGITLFARYRCHQQRPLHAA
jgi:hypothetical protein